MFDSPRDSGEAGADEEPAADPSSSREESTPGDRRTPVTWDAITTAQSEITDELLTEDDRPLVDVLDAIQQYIDNQEYVDRPGNAFIEQLLSKINNRNALHRLIDVGDREVFVVLPAEDLAQIVDELGLSDREMIAARDTHHVYAEMHGLDEYVTLVNVLCIRLYDERLAAFLETVEPEHADVSDDVLDELVADLRAAR